jgi:flagellar basal body-associated protein FliL
MTDFDPEKFEDKYVHYFPELQRAYKNAFHAIDQQILNESEPFYDDGAFRIELPDDPADRVTAIVVDDEKLSAALDAYVDEIREQLRHVFGLVDVE